MYKYENAALCSRCINSMKERKVKVKKWNVSLSVKSSSLQTLWTVTTRLLCLWNSPGKNTRVGCHALLQILTHKRCLINTCWINIAYINEQTKVYKCEIVWLGHLSSKWLSWGLKLDGFDSVIRMQTLPVSGRDFISMH